MTKDEIVALRKVNPEFDAGYRETDEHELPARVLSMGLDPAFQSVFDNYLGLVGNLHRCDFDNGVLAAYLEFIRRHDHIKPKNG
ncbi:MAG: hypothetical protein HY291_17425 [Planctomycetes bacterium]|nr:hypothetical protein [Planctomycetota bacterium]